MNRTELILPEDFYNTNSEKIKINWFCFEYASELFSAIPKKIEVRLKRKGITDERIAEFCIRYSKQMKSQIFKVLSKQEVNMILPYEPIEEFFPDIGDELVDDILTVVAEAWDSLLEICVVCPARCISEKDEKANMFDQISDCDFKNV